MNSQFLLQLPAHLEKAYRLGDIAVNSGVARYAKGANAGQIVAHLEPAMPMLSTGIGAVSPQAAAALEVAKLAKGAVDTAKLNKIIQLTQSVQTLSAVNLAISGVSLGVSVAGFAMILHKLKQLHNQLASIETKVDSLKKNESIKLIREIKLGFKHSVTLVYQLEDQGWSASLDTEIAKQLDRVEVLLAEVIDRYIDRNDVNVSSDLAQYLYNSYANLLKVHLTARYEQKRSLDYTAQRIHTLKNFSNQLTSPDLMDELYESYLFNQEHRFLESELDCVFDLYKYGCQNVHHVVSNHHEILASVSLSQFKHWRESLRKSRQSLIWIEHTVRR